MLDYNFETKFYELMIDDVKGTEQFSIPIYRFQVRERESMSVLMAVMDAISLERGSSFFGRKSTTLYDLAEKMLKK